ncbi:MAG TPA: SpoIVB peptidase S55 domain-containing protein, partial [Abditibacteriaceae bacterium]|nr:SpoIVB peptidase S55 domain-containing protein [Abditibacteriaceae bacterium]
MRRFLSVRPNSVVVPLLATSFLPFLSVPTSAQTKPSTQVPVVKRTQSQALVQQLLREGKIMRARDVKRGMKGYSLSVFQGTTIEKFPIEVIGVLESVNGGGDFVLFRATGGTVIKRQSSIVSGMSGSPVYINGKLLGAIAIGFGFPKEAIGGITPIADMIASTLPDPSRTRSVASSGATKAASGAAKAKAGAQSSTRSSAALAKRVNLEAQVWRPREVLRVAGRNISRVLVSRDRTRLALSGDKGAATMTMYPATMLLQVSGFSSEALPRLQRVLAPYGLEPTMGGGRSSSGRSSGGRSFGGGSGAQVFNMSSKKTGVKAAFIPGGALGAQMVSGDIDMTGVGTITYRIGNRVLAFGHPMLGLGDISLPMTSAYIHDIFPSYQSSFKLASPIQTLGAIQQDTNFAIGGTVGAKADTVPMMVMIRNPQRQIAKTYRVQIMKDPVLTPTLIQSVAAEMIDTTLGKESDKMVSISLRMKLRDQPDVVRRNLLYAPGDIVSSSLNDLNEALLVTQTNSFARGAIQGVNVEVDVQAVRKTARIKSIFADRNKVKAGQTVRISVELAPTTAPNQTITKTFAFTVPADAPTGVLRIAAGASGDYWGLATRVGNAPPDPENLGELLTAYSRIGAQNELMIQASTPRAFLLVDRTKVPNPPGSWSRLLRQSSSSSVAAYNETQTQTAPVDYSLSGNQFLAIPVESIKRSDQNSPDASGAAAPSTTDSASSATPAASSNPATSASTVGDIDSATGGLRSLPSKLFGGQSSAPASGFRAFENALQRGLGHSGFRGKFSPIEYSMDGAQSLQAQSLQAPANPNAPQPQNPIAPSVGSLVRPTPGVPGPPSATPTPIPTPSPTPPTDNGTNLSRPALRWVQNSVQEFTRGDFSGAQVTSEGAVQLSPRVRQLATTAEPFAWSVAGDQSGNTYLGTGNNARIYK